MDTMTTTQTTGLAPVVARTRPCTRRLGHGAAGSSASVGSGPRVHLSMWRSDLGMSTIANPCDNYAFPTTDAVIETKRCTRHLGTRST